MFFSRKVVFAKQQHQQTRAKAELHEQIILFWLLSFIGNTLISFIWPNKLLQLQQEAESVS